MPRTHALRWVAGLALIAVLGCASKTEQSSTTQTASEPPATSIDTSTALPPSGPAGWQAVQQGEASLKSIIEAGQLNKVHDGAVAIQAALKNVVSGASALSGDQRAQVETRIAAADKLADALHDAADAGDLTKTRSEFERFQAELRAIEGLLGAGGQ